MLIMQVMNADEGELGGFVKHIFFPPTGNLLEKQPDLFFPLAAETLERWTLTSLPPPAFFPRFFFYLSPLCLSAASCMITFAT